MSSKLQLGLVGKLYKDTIFYVDELELGETNYTVRIEEKLGGAFNILNASLLNIEPKCFCSGERDAIILSETKKSQRTSIVSKSSDEGEPNLDIYDSKMDWLHVLYIDDYYPIDMSRIKSKVSIDFCTDQPRKLYESYIENSDIVFDSRERKGLYSKIRSSTPIILHDKMGCECVWMGNVVFKSKIDPIYGLNVNGAGDLFAAIFIRELVYSDFQTAMEMTSTLVTEILKKRSKH